MTIPQTVSSADIDRADRVRERADTAYALIRSQTDLTVDAQRRKMATAYTDAETEMRALEAASSGNYAQRRQQAITDAFGVDDLAAPTSTNRPAVMLSYRDALDRCDSLDDVEAGRLLQRADESGDEVLARAIGRRAYDGAASFMGGGGWGDVLAEYASTRPKQAEAITRLQALQGALTSRGLFAWVLATPPELGGMQPFQINALAAQA